MSLEFVVENFIKQTIDLIEKNELTEEYFFWYLNCIKYAHPLGSTIRVILNPEHMKKYDKLSFKNSLAKNLNTRIHGSRKRFKISFRVCR